MSRALAALLIALVLIAGCATASAPAQSPTPKGDMLATYSGVCGISATPTIEVPAGAIIHWSYAPTADTWRFEAQAMFSSGSYGTIASNESTTDTNGNVKVVNADDVSFMVHGYGCTWEITVYSRM